MPFETYRRWVTMRAGFYKVYHTKKGELYEAESISFASMDEQTFEEVYSRVLNVIIKDLDSSQELIEGMLTDFM